MDLCNVSVCSVLYYTILTIYYMCAYVYTVIHTHIYEHARSEYQQTQFGN